MKIVHKSQLILAALVLVAAPTVKAVVGPSLNPNAPQTSSPPPPPVKVSHADSGPTSVDHIQGIGKYKLGANLKDYASDALQIIDPRAKGELLKVSPYGDNYLVNDLTGLTWGNVPISGLILTFHDDILVDIQIALKAKKVDLYLADRAFKDKYGSNSIRTFPVEGWSGDRVQVTLLFVGMNILDDKSLDGSAEGKVEFFDQAQWNKFEAVRKAKLDAVLNKTYQDAGNKVKDNL